MRASLYTAVLCPTAFASFLTHAPRPTPGEQDPVPISLRGEQEQPPRVLPGGQTLHDAVKSRSPEEVKELIQEGEKVNEVDVSGDTPLQLATKSCRPKIVKILIGADADVNKQDSFGDTPLHLATKSCQPEIVKILIDAGADVNTPNADRNTPLHHAALFRRPKIVKILIGADADVNTRNKRGDTPLHHAMELYQPEIVKILIDAGADVNTPNMRGDTPLHTATLLDRPEIVEILIKKKADVDYQNMDDKTPLHYATRSGQVEIVKMLIEAGADVDKPDALGEKPFVLHLKSRRTLGRTLSREMAELVVKYASFKLNEDQRKLPVEGNLTLGELEEVKNPTTKAINEPESSLSSITGVLDRVADFVQKLKLEVNQQTRVQVPPFQQQRCTSSAGEFVQTRLGPDRG